MIKILHFHIFSTQKQIILLKFYNKIINLYQKNIINLQKNI